MVKCRDIAKMNLDGMWLLAGKAGLDRVVSWTYVVLTRPFDDHMNHGNFAFCGVDFERFDWDEVEKIMLELNDLKISGFAVSIKDEKEPVPERILNLAEELALPLFQIRWEKASFVDLAQSIGNYIVEENNKANREGDFLYNLLFGYDINERYIEKIAGLFGMDFSIPHRVGIIVVDRVYGDNLENDEHTYNYYMSCMTKMISDMEDATLFMNFLNKGVILFPDYEDDRIIKKLEHILNQLDEDIQFRGRIKSTCILGRPYLNPQDYGKSYQEAKSLICKKDALVSSQKKKVISSSMMGIYKFLFANGNREEIGAYCEKKLRKLEEYDSANSTDLIDTFLAYYMNGFNVSKTATALYIHRNTLQYRLAKISELLELELDDYRECLEIINCIMVKKMMFSQ